MNITLPGIYHIYNRGNNQQTVFFNDDNYIYFLNKCHRYIKPVCAILAWCLMTNHFHFLLEVTQPGLKPVRSGGISMPAITNGFRLLQSSYTKGVNIQQQRTGNLFQQKTKAKLISGDDDYSLTAFHYVHQNPWKAGMVNKPEDWLYSSCRDYAGLRSGTLCDKQRAIQLFGSDAVGLTVCSVMNIDENKIEEIFD